MFMSNALPAQEIETAEEALIRYQREHYGPMWSHKNEDEAAAMRRTLVALYERHDVPEFDRLAI